MPTILCTIIEPCALERMESYFSVIFFWSREVYLMVSTVEISSPEHLMSLTPEFIHILPKFRVEHELALPCIL